MKTAREWAREWLFRSPKDDGDIEVLAVAIEARDREVRAAALREAVETMAMANDGTQSPFAVLMRLAIAAEASK